MPQRKKKFKYLLKKFGFVCDKTLLWRINNVLSDEFGHKKTDGIDKKPDNNDNKRFLASAVDTGALTSQTWSIMIHLTNRQSTGIKW